MKQKSNPAVELGRKGGQAFREKMRKMKEDSPAEYAKLMKKLKIRGKQGAAKRWGKKGGK